MGFVSSAHVVEQLWRCTVRDLLSMITSGSREGLSDYRTYCCLAASRALIQMVWPRPGFFHAEDAGSGLQGPVVDLNPELLGAKLEGT